MPEQDRIDDVQLRRFIEGKLDSEVEIKVALAVEKSPALQAQMAAISSDDFLKRVQEVAAASRESSPQHEQTQDTLAFDTSAQTKTLEDIPQELLKAADYKILKELGRGGMGVVYAAKYLPMDRMEVLKVLNEQMVEKETARQRFVSEMKAIGKLNHPFIATAYQQVPLPTQLVFSMEYVPGIDLHQFAAKYNPVPVPVACALASQIAKALHHAHQRGMVHRDIKPSNVMVHKHDGNLQVKILDFGLAKATSEQQAHGLTAHGTMLGTPEYMAPEQAIDAASADIRADIYSLGCTLYHLLLGNPPFTGTYQSILMAHAQKEPDPISLKRPEVPAELSKIVGKMIAKIPGKRYETPKQVATALKPFLGRAKLEPQPTAKKLEATDTKLNLASPSRDTSIEAPAEPIVAPAARPISAPKSSVDNQPSLEIIPQERETTKRLNKSKSERWLTPKRVLTAVGLASVILLLFSSVLAVLTKHGTLVFENLPPNATVSVDGEQVELTQANGSKYQVRVVPGEHQIEVKHGTAILFGEKVAIAVNGTKAIAISLKTNEDAFNSAAALATEEDANPRIPESSRDYEILLSESNTSGFSSLGPFSIKDGLLVSNGQRGNAISRKEYRDFELIAEWKMGANSNSGIYYRSPSETTIAFGNEYAIATSTDPKGFSNNQKTGSLFGVLPAETISRTSPGIWHTTRIVCNADNIEHWLDGKMALTYNVRDDFFRKALSEAKLKNNQKERIGKQDRGHILLQSLSGEIAFRSVRVRSLEKVINTSSESAHHAQDRIALFDGSSLTGWSGDTAYWSFEDGSIVGHSSYAKPLRINKYLVSEQTFNGNFNLEFDCKITGGNSGVVYRTSRSPSDPFYAWGLHIDIDYENNQFGHAYEEKGFASVAEVGESVVITSSGKISRESLPTPSSTGDSPASSAWRHYRVVSVGDTLEHYVNGILISRITDPHRCLSQNGIVALQLHRGQPMTVRFRNIVLTQGKQIQLGPSDSGIPLGNPR